MADRLSGWSGGGGQKNQRDAGGWGRVWVVPRMDKAVQFWTWLQVGLSIDILFSSEVVRNRGSIFLSDPYNCFCLTWGDRGTRVSWGKGWSWLYHLGMSGRCPIPLPRTRLWCKCDSQIRVCGITGRFMGPPDKPGPIEKQQLQQQNPLWFLWANDIPTTSSKNFICRNCWGLLLLELAVTGCFAKTFYLSTKISEFLDFEDPNSGCCKKSGFQWATGNIAQFQLAHIIYAESWTSLNLEEVCLMSVPSVYCLSWSQFLIAATIAFHL